MQQNNILPTALCLTGESLLSATGHVTYVCCPDTHCLHVVTTWHRIATAFWLVSFHFTLCMLTLTFTLRTCRFPIFCFFNPSVKITDHLAIKLTQVTHCL